MLYAVVQPHHAKIVLLEAKATETQTKIALAPSAERQTGSASARKATKVQPEDKLQSSSTQGPWEFLAAL